MLVNKSQNKNLDTVYLAYNCKPEDIPQGPPFRLEGDPTLERFVKKLQEAMDKRPVWTRRALQNQVAREPGLYMLKQAMQYVGYQFKSGPFRDAIIKFGVDPRADKSFRIYQTLWFKLYEKDKPVEQSVWQEKRSEYIKRRQDPSMDQTHIFDGTKVELDGKLWSICDVTDPLLVKLINTVQLRDKFDKKADGWYCNGSMAKIKSIMKTKLLALRAHRPIQDYEFDEAMAYPDVVEGRTSRDVRVPVPDVRMTQEDVDELTALGIETGLSSKGIMPIKNKRIDWARRRNEARIAAEAAIVKKFGAIADQDKQGDIVVDGDVLVMGKGKKKRKYKKKGGVVGETEEEKARRLEGGLDEVDDLSGLADYMDYPEDEDDDPNDMDLGDDDDDDDDLDEDGRGWTTSG